MPRPLTAGGHARAARAAASALSGARNARGKPRQSALAFPLASRRFPEPDTLARLRLPIRPARATPEHAEQMTGVVIGRHFAPLFSQHTLRSAGVIGAAGSLIAATGDFVTAYTAAPLPAMNTVPWLSFADFADFVAPKSQLDLLLGHYLGVLFIPLNVLGLWHVYLALAPATPRFALAFLASGASLAVVGAAFHGTVGLAVTAIRVGDAETLTHAVAYVEPLAWILTVAGSALFLALAGVIWRARTAFPRWMAWISPLLMQLWLIAAAHLLPLELANVLLLTGFNLSVFIFFAVSTVILWHHQPLQARR